MATAAATMKSSTMPLIVISQSRGLRCAMIYLGQRLGWFTRLNFRPRRMNFPGICVFPKVNAGGRPAVPARAGRGDDKAVKRARLIAVPSPAPAFAAAYVSAAVLLFRPAEFRPAEFRPGAEIRRIRACAARRGVSAVVFCPLDACFRPERRERQPARAGRFAGLRSNRTGFPAVVSPAAKLRLPAAVAYANDLQLHKFNLPFESA